MEERDKGIIVTAEEAIDEEIIVIAEEAIEVKERTSNVWVRVRDAYELYRSERNPKLHDIGALVESIERYGYCENAIYDRALGGIKHGNGRIEALWAMERSGRSVPRGIACERGGGAWCVQIQVGLDAASEAEAVAYAIDANNLTMSGGDYSGIDMARMWEVGEYERLLREVAEAGSIPVSVDEDIDALLQQLSRWNEIEAGALAEAEGEEGDEVEISLEEAQAKHNVREGDVFRVATGGGIHFVACGDCRDEGIWDRLVGHTGDKEASLRGIFTSPPYAEQRRGKYEGVAEGEYLTFWDSVQRLAWKHLDPGDGSFFINLKAHVEGGQRRLYVMELVIAMVQRWGWKFFEEWCWRKTGVPGDYSPRFRNDFEPVYQFVRQKARPRYENVLQVGTAVRAGGGLGEQGSGDSILGEQVKYHGLVRPGNVIEAGMENIGEFRGHPAAFPTKLPKFFLAAYSDIGDTWLDPFLGSGTLIIACHQTRRNGLGIELKPEFVALSLERLSVKCGAHVERV